MVCVGMILLQGQVLEELRRDLACGNGRDWMHVLNGMCLVWWDIEYFQSECRTRIGRIPLVKGERQVMDETHILSARSVQYTE